MSIDEETQDPVLVKLAAIARESGTEGFDDRAALGRAHERIGASEVARRASIRIWDRGRSVWGWAAGLATAAMVVFGITITHIRHLERPLHQYATASGQRLNITLSDGTKVMLAPESRLRTSDDYQYGARTVTLDGEAYFKVVHNVRHPFAVLTHNVQINDVGTEFDVRGYDDAIRVAVAKGEVVVGQERAGQIGGEGRAGQPEPRFARLGLRPAPTTANDVAYLTAGDMAEATNTGFTVIHHADVAAQTAWTQGGLAFDATPLRQVVQDVSRSFGVTITIADSALADKRVTASFPDANLDEVLDAITQVVGARYLRTARAIVIRSVASKEPLHGNTPRAPLVTARITGES